MFGFDIPLDVKHQTTPRKAMKPKEYWKTMGLGKSPREGCRPKNHTLGLGKEETSLEDHTQEKLQTIRIHIHTFTHDL